MDRQIKVKDSASINFWALILLGFIFISLFLFPPLMKERLKAEREVAKLALEVEALKGKRTRLKEEERALRGDPFYNEVLARRELRMLKHGERAVPVERPPTYSRKKVVRREPKAASSKLTSFLQRTPLRLGLLIIGLCLIITALLTCLEEKSPKATTTSDQEN